MLQLHAMKTLLAPSAAASGGYYACRPAARASLSPMSLTRGLQALSSSGTGAANSNSSSYSSSNIISISSRSIGGRCGSSRSIRSCGIPVRSRSVSCAAGDGEVAVKEKPKKQQMIDTGTARNAVPSFGLATQRERHLDTADACGRRAVLLLKLEVAGAGGESNLVVSDRSTTRHARLSSRGAAPSQVALLQIPRGAQQEVVAQTLQRSWCMLHHVDSWVHC